MLRPAEPDDPASFVAVRVEASLFPTSGLPEQLIAIVAATVYLDAHCRGSRASASEVRSIMKFDATISGATITNCIEGALSCLRKNFRTGDGGAGWYHFLDDPDPGVTASAVGLFAFQAGRTSFERADEVVSYLAGQQVSGEPQIDGGWPVRTTQGFPITEATAWVVKR